MLFLCREVLGVEVEDLALAARAKRGTHLPVVLSMPETAALLGAMRGTTWLMAALIYGGGLRVKPYSRFVLHVQSAPASAIAPLACECP